MKRSLSQFFLEVRQQLQFPGSPAKMHGNPSIQRDPLLEKKVSEMIAGHEFTNEALSSMVLFCENIQHVETLGITRYLYDLTFGDYQNEIKEIAADFLIRAISTEAFPANEFASSNIFSYLCTLDVGHKSKVSEAAISLMSAVIEFASSCDFLSFDIFHTIATKALSNFEFIAIVVSLIDRSDHIDPNYVEDLLKIIEALLRSHNIYIIQIGLKICLELCNSGIQLQHEFLISCAAPFLETNDQRTNLFALQLLRFFSEPPIFYIDRLLENVELNAFDACSASINIFIEFEDKWDKESKNRITKTLIDNLDKCSFGNCELALTYLSYVPHSDLTDIEGITRKLINHIEASRNPSLFLSKLFEILSSQYSPQMNDELSSIIDRLTDFALSADASISESALSILNLCENLQ